MGTASRQGESRKRKAGDSLGKLTSGAVCKCSTHGTSKKSEARSLEVVVLAIVGDKDSDLRGSEDEAADADVDADVGKQTEGGDDEDADGDEGDAEDADAFEGSDREKCGDVADDDARGTWEADSCADDTEMLADAKSRSPKSLDCSSSAETEPGSAWASWNRRCASSAEAGSSRASPAQSPEAARDAGCWNSRCTTARAARPIPTMTPKKKDTAFPPRVWSPRQQEDIAKQHVEAPVVLHSTVALEKKRKRQKQRQELERTTAKRQVGVVPMDDKE